MSTQEASIMSGPGGGSGGLAPLNAGGGDLGGGKPTEEQIVQSFNTPNKEEVIKEPVVEQVEVKEEVVVEKEDEQVEINEDEQQSEEEAEIVTEEDLSVSKINQFTKEVPELKVAFDKNPALRNTVYAMARRSAKLGEYQQVIPTVEAAKFAAQNSEQLMQFNDLYFSDKAEDQLQWWDSLYENSQQRDPATGHIIVDERGRPRSTGAYERVTSAYRNSLYAELDGLASKITDPETNKAAREAVALVRELAGDGKRQQTKEAEPKLTPEQERELAEGKQAKTQLEQERAERVRTFNTETMGGIVSSIKEDIGGHVARIVKTQGVALTPYEQRNVVNDIFGAIDQLAAENRQYQNHFSNLLKRAPQTEAGRKSLIAEARKFTKEVLPSVAIKVIREATSATVEKAITKVEKREKQASVKDVKTTGKAPSPTSPDIRSKASELRKQVKRQLTEDEILAL